MSGKVIAVTGASRGIGAEIAFELARRGHTVGCFTRSGAGPNASTSDAGGVGGARAGGRESGGRFINVRCDVTDEASVKEAFAELANAAGAVNGLVNNAGLHRDGRSEELLTAAYQEIMATNA